MKRKIAAILAADAAEYSRLVAEDEEEALRQLVASVAVFKTSVEAHGGRIFNTAGDAVLAEFQSAVQAVRSAIDIQETLSTRNQPYAPERRMMFRMGISIGDVVENEGDLLGDGVNIAARLQSLARPGGVAISRWVQEQVAGRVAVEFRDAGYQHVKNMPAPIHVFQSGAAAAPEARPVASSGRSARSWPLRAVAAGFAALLVAAVAFLLVRHDPATVVSREVPTETPAPFVAITAPQAIETPAPEPQPSASPAPDRPASKKEASVEPSAPLAPASPPSAAPVTPIAPPQQDNAVAPASEEPAQAAVTPATAPSAPESGQTATFESERASAPSPPPSAPVLARETASDPKQVRMQCAQIVERAQLGDLTSDDRAFLRNNCR